MLRLRDDRAREIYLPRPPRRVVSLVPSETETLFALGLGERLVGRTRFCVEPADRVGAVPEVGGTKDPDVDAISALEPDLVLANQEENTRAALETLAQRGVSVFIGFPRRVADAVAHVARLARMFGVAGEPAARDAVREAYAALAAAPSPAGEPLSVFVPIWMDPLMTISADTYGSDLLSSVGAVNVFADRRRRYPLAADLGNAAPADPGERDTRYPRVTSEELIERAPSVVLLPDEPHPFGEEEAAVFRGLLPDARVVFCDGKDLFWPGTRTAGALARLRAQLAALR